MLVNRAVSSMWLFFGWCVGKMPRPVWQVGCHLWFFSHSLVLFLVTEPKKCSYLNLKRGQQ